MVDEGQLEWKPPSGDNWMTTGQLLRHMTDACGKAMKGFLTGDWGLPEGMEISQLSPEDMLPPAGKMPSIGSVAEAIKLLDKDKQLALQMVEQAGEEKLNNQTAPAPWDPTEMILGERFSQMVLHLFLHKAQLFYYLKLQEKPVTTSHLW